MSSKGLRKNLDALEKHKLFEEVKAAGLEFKQTHLKSTSSALFGTSVLRYIGTSVLLVIF